MKIYTRVLSEKIRQLVRFQEAERQKLLATDFDEDEEKIESLNGEIARNELLANVLWQLGTSIETEVGE